VHIHRDFDGGPGGGGRSHDGDHRPRVARADNRACAALGRSRRTIFVGWRFGRHSTGGDGERYDGPDDRAHVPGKDFVAHHRACRGRAPGRRWEFVPLLRSIFIAAPAHPHTSAGGICNFERSKYFRQGAPFGLLRR
jgi:hypothetical protein